MIEKPAIFESLGVRVDPAAFRAELGGRRLELEPKAFDLLVLLVSQPGRLVTKQEILDEVWKGTAVSDNALTRVVAQLRKALGDDAREARYLETVPTRGYRWVAPVSIGRVSVPDVRDQTGVVPGSDPGQTRVRTGSDPGRPGRRPGVKTLAVVGGIALLAALVLGARSLIRETDDGRTLFPRQLSVSAGLDVYPALSPDGRTIAFSSDRTGAWEIYAAPVEDARADAPVTADGQQNVHAAWSPDGSSIAYHSMRRGGIWIVPGSGGTPRQVTEFGARPAWSPDGQQIAFQSDPAPDIGPAARAANLPSTIWIVNLAGGQPKPLTRPGVPIGGHGAPTWSSEGRRVAFAAAEFGVSQIWATQVEGGEPFPLTDKETVAFDPVFLRRGAALLFSDGSQVWRVPLDRSGRRSGPLESYLPAGLNNVRHLSVSNAGRLAMAALDLRSSLWSAPVDDAGRRNGESRSLTNDTRRRNSVPAFSPDGSQVAVTSSVAGGSPDVWVMRADGSDLRRVTSSPSYEGMPTWMPDGGRLFFKSLRDGAWLWEVSIETLRERPVVRLGAGSDLARQQGLVQEARVSPDGTRVAYAALDPQTSNKALYVQELPDGVPVRLTTGDPPASYPAWSADGAWLACELFGRRGTSVAVLPASGGTPRQLTFADGHSWVHSWSPDGARIAFAGQRDGVWNVYWVPREGGEEVRVTNNTQVGVFIRYPAWSPRGDQIVFEHGDVRGNVWLVELP